MPDPLRYGGDKRESLVDFWFNLLEEFGCKYYSVHSEKLDDVIVEIRRVIDSFMKRTYKPIATFERE